MQAMQYEITLPADYDMAIIRQRVATKGAMTDDFEGLGLKAYGIRERGVDGSPVNQYAPFYLWASVEGMNQFLWGAGFAGLSRDFGRPIVRQWTGLAFERGPADRAAVDRSGPRTRAGERRGPGLCDAAHRDDRARRRRHGSDRGRGGCDTRACPRERSPLDRARRRHVRMGARAVHAMGEARRRRGRDG